MTIFQIIRNDHKKIKSLLAKLDKTTEENVVRRKFLFKAFKEVLVNHAKSEEKAVYRPMKSKEKTREFSFEGYEEHHVVDKLMKSLSTLSPSKETWTAKMTVVKELLEHHIKEEEDEMFKKLRQSFQSEELTKIAIAMKIQKKIIKK